MTFVILSSSDLCQISNYWKITDCRLLLWLETNYGQKTVIAFASIVLNTNRFAGVFIIISQAKSIRGNMS